MIFVNKKVRFKMTDNEKDYIRSQLIDYLSRITSKKGKKFICPLCGSGTGPKGTPAFNIVPGSNNTKFKCHSCGAGEGDIFDLYRMVNNTDLETAFKELQRMYNIMPTDNSYRQPTAPKQTAKPQQVDYTNFFIEAHSDLNKCDYLIKRGISEEIQDRFNIGYVPNWRHPNVSPKIPTTPRIIIPTSKYSYIARDTRQNIPENQQQYNKSKVGNVRFLNISDLEKEICFIVEGEIDALSVIQCGYPCIALGSVNMLDKLLTYCKKKKPSGVLIFALDNDQAGQTATAKIPAFQQVGIKCMTANISGKEKDPNDLLISDSKQLIHNLQLAVDRAKQMQFSFPAPTDARPVQENNVVVPDDERPLQPNSFNYDASGRLTIYNLEVFLKNKGITTKYNIISHKIEYDGYDSNESPEHITDTMISIIYDEMQHNFKGCTMDKIPNFLNVIATRNKYNPVLEMLNSTTWDGTDRLKQIYEMLQIHEDDELSRILLKKWFMQCICGLHNDDLDNPFSLDIVLIFQGLQGAGKTRLFEHLAMKKNLFGEGAIIDPRDKDTQIKATSRWICELGEISTTMKKDIDSLKAFLTMSTDTYRKPYGKSYLEYNRMTSFCGTTNDERFLIDETGNRRFATVPLDDELYIDYDTQVKPFDSLQFWCQIAEIVETEIKQNNKSYASVFRLTREELKALNERNREFEKTLKGEEEVTDVLYKLENMMQDPAKNVVMEYMTVTDFIQQNTELKGLNTRQVGKVLDKLNYPMIKKKINGSVQRIRRLPKFKGIANCIEYNG